MPPSKNQVKKINNCIAQIESLLRAHRPFAEYARFVKQLRELGGQNELLTMGRYQFTLLTLCIRTGTPSDVQDLLTGEENPINVLQQNSDGSIALHMVVKMVEDDPSYDYKKVLSLLLYDVDSSVPVDPQLKARAQAQLVARNNTGIASLHGSVMLRRPDLVRAFLRYSECLPVLTIFPERFGTPLGYAIANNLPEMVDVLLECDPERQLMIPNKNGYLPIHAAVCVSRSEMVKKLLRFIPERQLLYRAENDIILLHVVVCSEKLSSAEKLEIIEELLKVQTEKQLTAVLRDNNHTPLFSAIESHETAIAEKLASFTACREQFLLSDKLGMFPIHATIYHDAKAAFKIMVAQGPVEQVTIPYNGLLPIQIACLKGKSEYVAAVLEKYPEHLYKVSLIGHTTLILAVIGRHYNLAKFLLTKSSQLCLQLDQVTNVGLLPIHYALGARDEKMIDILLQQCVSEQLNLESLFAAISFCSIDMVRLILSKIDKDKIKEFVNQQDAFGDTPLHCACKMGKVDVVDCLVKNGASVAVLNKSGQFPFHTACANGQVDVVRWFIDGHHHNVNLPLINGLHPILIALAEHNFPVVNLLLPFYQQLFDTSDTQNKLAINSLLWIAVKELVGDVTVVTFLMSIGADPKYKFPDGSTVIDIVKNYPDDELKSNLLDLLEPPALSTATFFGKQDAVQKLSAGTGSTSAAPLEVKVESLPVWDMSDANGHEQAPSGISYLKQLGLSDDAIKNIKKEQKLRNQKLKEPKAKQPITRQQALFKWFDGKLTSTSDQVMSVENSRNGNAFCYLPTACLAEQGCEAASFSNSRLKFGHKSLKKLTEEYKDFVKLPGSTEVVEGIYTHELKIPGVDRILLFEVQSDTGHACLYVGSRFVDSGLHNMVSIKALEQSGKSRESPLIIDLPRGADMGSVMTPSYR
jgi:ankyrin repeat protein